VRKRRRKARLGDPLEDHARRARQAATDVETQARVSVSNASQGFCTRAYDALMQADEAYGMLRANVRAGGVVATTIPRKALTDARGTFFRRCVVPR